MAIAKSQSRLPIRLTTLLLGPGRPVETHKNTSQVTVLDSGGSDQNLTKAPESLKFNVLSTSRPMGLQDHRVQSHSLSGGRIDDNVLSKEAAAGKGKIFWPTRGAIGC